VILTVSESLGQGWREAFEKEGAEVWELPMTKIRHLKPKASWKDQVAKTKWVVFTSGAGVRALPGILGDLRKLAGKKIAVVGRSTAAILNSIGLKADFVGPGPGAEALAKAWPGKKQDSVLHLTGGEEGGKFARILQRKGYRVGRIEVYQNHQPPRPSRAILNALKKEGADWVVFASGTAAVRFRRLVPNWAHQPKAAVIGPATAKVAKANGWRVRVVSRVVSPQGVLAGILKS
jgi:uroporphyrinogen-III synthase